MISDNCQQCLQDLFPGLWQPVPGSASKSFGLDYFPLHALPYVYPHWSSYANIVPFVQFCEILQDFLAIGMAFDCPKEVRSIHRPGNFVRISFCRLWMMLNKESLQTPTAASSPPWKPFICFSPLHLLSVQKWTFPPYSVMSFFNDHQQKNKIQGLWGRKALLKWASHLYSPRSFLTKTRPLKIYSYGSICRKGDPENIWLPWINLRVVFEMYRIISRECSWLSTLSLCFHPGKPQMYLVARDESSVKEFASVRAKWNINHCGTWCLSDKAVARKESGIAPLSFTATTDKASLDFPVLDKNKKDSTEVLWI